MVNLKEIFLLIGFLLSLVPLQGVCSDTIHISNDKGTYELRGSRLDILEDPGGKLSIEDVTFGKFASEFKPNTGDVPKNTNEKYVYWIRFTLTGESLLKEDIFFELLDFRIDSYRFYIPDPEGGFIVKEGGDRERFNKKAIPHKNFIRKIPNPATVPQTYYVRLQAEHPIGIIGKITTLSSLFNYANNEYFLLAIFYGIVVSMALYNFLLFFSTREKTYLYYVLYVLSIGVYALTQDGIGFQFVWPDLPILNDVVYPLALFSMIFWLLLYARSFLGTKSDLPFFDKGIVGFLAIRALMLFAGFAFYKPLLHLPLLDLLPMLFVFIAGIIKYRKGYIAARYYLFAFTFMFFGYGISALSLMKIIPDSIYTVYCFNFGVVGQMIFLSLALADRIKMLVKENEDIHKLIILQLKEKKELKDKVNLELEEKVMERTKELEEKNAQLDTFVYKASHDIKGPLRSIIGLTTVGMKDVKDEVGRQYLEYILKSTKRLDSILADLLNLTRVKSAKLEKVPIDFKAVLKEVLDSFGHHPDYNNIDFILDIDQKEEFVSDKKLLVSIIQNFIENGIKYHDKEKEKPYQKIKIATDASGVSMVFEDNGLGLAPESQGRIFDMFYKVKEDSVGTGLGLYLVKMAVDKLGGTIKVESKEGEGAKFTVKIPAKG